MSNFCISPSLAVWITREGELDSGQQKARWADEIGEFAGVTWLQLLQDQDKCRNSGDGFALLWVKACWYC